MGWLRLVSAWKGSPRSVYLYFGVFVYEQARGDVWQYAYDFWAYLAGFTMPKFRLGSPNALWCQV